MVKDKREADAIITLYDRHGRREWRVACILPDDDEASMRRHLKRHNPGATFLGVRFEEQAENDVEAPGSPGGQSMTDELRAAAERLRSADWDWDNMDEHHSLCAKLAQAWLAEHQADDETKADHQHPAR